MVLLCTVIIGLHWLALIYSHWHGNGKNHNHIYNIMLLSVASFYYSAILLNWELLGALGSCPGWFLPISIADLRREGLTNLGLSETIMEIKTWRNGPTLCSGFVIDGYFFHYHASVNISMQHNRNWFLQ